MLFVCNIFQLLVTQVASIADGLCQWMFGVSQAMVCGHIFSKYILLSLEYYLQFCCFLRPQIALLCCCGDSLQRSMDRQEELVEANDYELGYDCSLVAYLNLCYSMLNSFAFHECALDCAMLSISVTLMSQFLYVLQLSLFSCTFFSLFVCVLSPAVHPLVIAYSEWHSLPQLLIFICRLHISLVQHHLVGLGLLVFVSTGMSFPSPLCSLLTTRRK